MKSIDKLRKFVKDRFVINSQSLNSGMQIADEIEAEIAERYMELPADADGVPICVGDVVAAQDEQPFEVRAFQLDALGWFAIERLGSQWNVNQLHHVKPRTLEDVLRSYVCDFADSSGPDYDEEITRKYADEIRELLGGGAE